MARGSRGAVTVDSRVAENLFVVMFGLTFAWMGDIMLDSLLPGGVNVLFKQGWRQFGIRAMMVCLTFCLSAVGFVLSLVFCGRVIPRSWVAATLDVMIILVLSASPWTAYHVVRVVMRPLAFHLYEWDGVVRNVDVLYLGLYVLIAGLLFALRHVLHWRPRRSSW